MSESDTPQGPDHGPITAPTAPTASPAPALPRPGRPEPVPLNALRVFVEAARWGSFKRTGQHLGLTQSGVSRHVATLEAWLGQPLFRRGGAGLSLTDAGRLYFDTVQDAMATIELTSQQLRSRTAGPSVLQVRTSLPSLAMAVLIPALSRFQQAHQVTVELTTSLAMPQADDAFDVLVTRDLNLGHAEQWHLAHEELVAVATPDQLRRWQHTPVQGWPLLVARSRPDVLAQWSRQQGTGAGTGALHIQAGFDHYFLAIAAALSGAGVLVAPSFLVASHLQQGLLAELPLERVRGEGRYLAFIHPRSTQPDPARAFCRWIKAELAASQPG